MPFLTILMHIAWKITNLIVAAGLDLRSTLFHSVIGFFHHSSTSESLLLHIPIEELYLSLKALIQ